MEARSYHSDPKVSYTLENFDCRRSYSRCRHFRPLLYNNLPRDYEKLGIGAQTNVSGVAPLHVVRWNIFSFYVISYSICGFDLVLC